MRNFYLSLLFIIQLCFNLSCSSNGSGKYNKSDKATKYKVISIDDGDTFDILVENKTVKIRMDAIDAPEKGMPYWKKSKQFLADLVFNKEVTIKIVDIDGRGRTVARSYLDDGTDVSLEMVKAGLAWHYKKYNKEAVLEDLEKQAIAQKIGLWNDPNPYNPEYIRKLHKQGISTKDTFRQKK